MNARRGLTSAVFVGVLVALIPTAAMASDPWFKAGTVDDPAITESSGIALSVKHSGYAYTINDDEKTTRTMTIYTILVSSGAVKGVTTLHGVTPVDPEALSVDEKGQLWIADMGEDGRDWGTELPTLYMIPEPGTGTHDITPKSYPITHYPGDAKYNIETLLVRPKSSDKYFVSKASPGQRLALYSTSTGRSVKVRETMPDHVSDGAFTPNGKWVVLINDKKGYVYSSSTWKLHATVKLPDFTDFEGISFNAKGDRFLLTRDRNATADSTNKQRKFTLYWEKFDQSKGQTP